MENAAFVGRDHELAAIEERLARAREGSGGLILVEGEAGMGKTSLGDAATRLARRDGMVTRWGACWEGGGAPAYWPWVQVLSAFRFGRARFLAEAAAGASRFRLFEDVVATLRGAAADRPVLIVLDDLHLADVPSLRLLQALSPELADFGLLVVGLHRPYDLLDPGEPTGSETYEIHQALLRTRGTSRIVLRGLDPAAVERLAASTAGPAASDRLISIVRQRAEGNPLFVVELARLDAVQADDVIALPTGIHQVISQRLDRLPRATRELLRQAAVLGREFSMKLLAEMAAISWADAIDGLAPAAQANVVTTGQAGAARFSHVLTRDVAYAELPADQRRLLHLRAARAIEHGSLPDLGHHLDALAHHLREAVTLGQADAALRATLEAAQRAGALLAYEHAAFQYREALDLLHWLPPNPQWSGVSVTRQWLLVELARSQFRSGAVSEAWDSLRNAADAARADADAVTLAQAALVIQGLTNDPVCAWIHALCREALTLLTDRDAVLRASLLGQLVVTADPWAGRPEERLGKSAMAQAEETGDPGARFLALRARYVELTDFARAEDRVAIGDLAVRLGRESGRPEYTGWGHVWRMDGLWQLSRRAELDTELAAYAGFAARSREPLVTSRLTLIQASVATMEGRFAAARELAGTARELGRKGGHRESEFLDVVFRAHLAEYVGDQETLENVEAFVRRQASGGPFMAHAWHASVLASMGRLDEAAAAFSHVAAHVRAFPRHTVEWIIATTANVNLCVLLHRQDLLPGLYEELLPFAGRQVTGHAHTPSQGPVDLYLGRIALALGDRAAAQKHLDHSLRLAGEMGSAPYEAITRLELARLLASGSHAEDHGNATAHLEAAHQTARRLGMRPLAAQTAAMLTASRTFPRGPLTEREHEIAGLIAEGLSNKQIATRLRLSTRTVEAHVRSIFAKLVCTSRARVAAWFVTEGAQRDRFQT